MPRDSSRPPSTSSLHRSAASPVSALAAFSALVAVSVAVSSGIDPTADVGAAFGLQGGPRPDAGWSLLAAGPQLQPPATPLRDERTVSVVRDGAPGRGSWRPGSGRGDGGAASSTVRPGRHVPALYDGELPVNTIIAPTSPGTVLHGGAFGWRTAPDHGRREFHNGTDISAAAGLPVVAALDGEVTAVYWDEWGGNRVEVAHAEGMTTTYSHLEDVQVQVGDRLAASEQLGSVGATGVRVTGPHLHFETWVDGEAVDPQSFHWIDGIHVIPASRGKYSLEVPVPDPAADAVVAAAPDRPGERATAEKPASADEHGRSVKPEKKDAAHTPPVTPAPAPSEPRTEQKTRKQPAQPAEAAPVVTAPAPVSPGPAPVEPVVAPAPVARVVTAPAPVAPVAPVVEQVPVAPVVTAPAPPGPEAGAPGGEPGVAPVAVPDTERDTDGDGVLDVEDPDLDGDGIPDELDDDLDGDGVANDVDPDVDGDGVRNEDDPDVDGDGLLNDDDEQPLPHAAKTASAPQMAGPAAEPVPAA